MLVTGVDPLRVYVHTEGLTRLSTSDYSLENIDNKFAHLTNYSINKNAESFKVASNNGDISSETDGFKWSLAAFRKWLAAKESPEVNMIFILTFTFLSFTVYLLLLLTLLIIVLIYFHFSFL